MSGEDPGPCLVSSDCNSYCNCVTEKSANTSWDILLMTTSNQQTDCSTNGDVSQYSVNTQSKQNRKLRLRQKTSVDSVRDGLQANHNYNTNQHVNPPNHRFNRPLNNYILKATRCNQNFVRKISKRLELILTILRCLTVLCCYFCLFSPVESCSSRSTPKPRLASPTVRPNVTFQTYACPEAYAKWYCLNGATCFSVRIGESILYNCECAHGYMGQRCEFKDLEGSYLPSREKVMIATANFAGFAVVALVFVVILFVASKLHGHFLMSRRRRPDRDACSIT